MANLETGNDSWTLDLMPQVITEVGHHLPNQAAASDPLPSSSTTILPTLLGSSE